ncbi:PIG-L deacetylase family protein [Williamsia sp. CHRR-6]|uniref:PIG-L deacetylase family protein n=1 Tax=Williamsia sp. CHRR-6 TaxID=2835871 RepID=UPI001BD95DA4|nr:PIG-L family deacetylase [Williamsia sp. CHRR-6]MBT0566271.1 PIG-L family deacetylase [Williamsia sp. CHRR-6]
MIGLVPAELTEIAVVGAHCDDIAIGLGGTLLTLTAAHPELTVRALVLTGGGTVREAEERAALAEFCGPSVDLTVCDLPDGRTPAHWAAVKEALHAFRLRSSAQIVFGPHRHDAHQDHRLLAELLPTEFRDQLILGYEIAKWETDTPTPTFFHPIDTAVAEEKSRLLHVHYITQLDHDWFDRDAFLGLTRLRGIQCHAAHAEAFVAEKAMLHLRPVSTQESQR